jgi:putative transposase
MAIYLAKKIRFRPTSEQKELLEQSFGVSRFCYNWGLDEWEKNYKREKKTSSPISLRNSLNKMKKEEYPWMYNVSKDIPYSSFEDLKRGFSNFFDKKLKAKYPRKKKKGKCSFSFRMPSDVVRPKSERVVSIAKIGKVVLCEDFKSLGKLMSSTVSRRADQYFISI